MNNKKEISLDDIGLNFQEKVKKALRVNEGDLSNTYDAIISIFLEELNTSSEYQKYNDLDMMFRAMVATHGELRVDSNKLIRVRDLTLKKWKDPVTLDYVFEVEGNEKSRTKQTIDDTESESMSR